jgi:hypothetical protein
MTDKWQTRPLDREGAPNGQDSNFHKKKTSLGLDTKTDRLTDRQLQLEFDFDFDFDFEWCGNVILIF